MLEYLRTDNSPLNITYSASSYATNVFFEVYDLDTEEFIQGGKGIAGASSIYTITLNTDSTFYDRNLKVEYVTTSASGAHNDIQYISIIRPYATISRIKEIVSVDASISNSQLQKLERRARLQINSALGFNFYKEKRSLTVYGNNTDILTLPENLFMLNSIYEDDILIYEYDNEAYQLDYDLEIGPSTRRIKILNSIDNSKEVDEFPKFSVFYYDGLFKKDYAYKIDGVWGWNYIPAEIEEATALLVNDYLCNDFNIRNKNIASLSNDSYNLKYADNANTGTGNLLVDNLLAPFKEPRYLVI